VKYVDQLSREVIVQQIASGATVTIKGYGIADRTYTITTGQISSNLRSDYASLQQPFLSGDYDLNMGGGHGFPGPHTDLFWDDVGGVGSDIYMMSEASDQSAVTRLDLLDGRSFRFRYNPYGELAEIVYPAGGISQIDYGPYGTSVVCEAPSWLAGIANRGAIERRTLTDGSTVDAVWSYTDDSFTQGGQTYQGRRVEVRQMPSNTLLSSESHFFLALNAEYRTCIDQNSDGTTYEAWQSGKPFRVERRTGSGTQVEIRDWSQRTPVSWAGSTNYAQEQPSNEAASRTWVEIEKPEGVSSRLLHVSHSTVNLRSNNQPPISQPIVVGFSYAASRFAHSITSGFSRSRSNASTTPSFWSSSI
jgi:hypothetical protein